MPRARTSLWNPRWKPEDRLSSRRERAWWRHGETPTDKVIFDYARITAPFAGVVTQRYANLGTLMQAGTNSSTQAMPLVRLSQDDLFRLVIPVPESYVKYIRDRRPRSGRVSLAWIRSSRAKWPASPWT